MTDLSLVVAVCSMRRFPVCTRSPRFDNKSRSHRHRRLRSRSRLQRKRSCLPQQVELRVPLAFPEMFTSTTRQTVPSDGIQNFSTSFKQASRRLIH